MEEEYIFLIKLKSLFDNYKNKSKKEIELFLDKHVEEYEKLINPSYKCMKRAKDKHSIDQIKRKEFARGYNIAQNI